MDMRAKVIKALMKAASALPLGLHRFNARIIGWIARNVVHYRLKVVRDNIDKAFPELNQKQRNRIIRDFYIHFGDLVCETVWFGGKSARQLRQSGICTIVNPEETVRLASVAKGTVILSGHFGNWEILGGFEAYCPEGREMAMNRSNTAMAYKELTDPLWDDIFKCNRTGILGPDFENYIESKNILRFMVTKGRNGMFTFLDNDQRPYKYAVAAEPVTFMGRSAMAMVGGIITAHKYGLAVSYCSMCRKPGRKGYTLELNTICDDASTMSVKEINDRFYALLEDDIRKDPGNYLWSHRRWKQVPLKENIEK